MLTMTIPPVAAATTLTGLYGPLAALAGIAVLLALGVIIGGLAFEQFASRTRPGIRPRVNTRPTPSMRPAA